MKTGFIALENTFAYLECLIKNVFTRIFLFLTAVGTFCATFHHSIFSLVLGIVYIVLGLILFYLSNFGRNSYYMYKRAFNHLVEYQQEVASKTYCGRVGCKVAERRFKKKYPEKYKTMMEKRKPQDVGMLFAQIAIAMTHHAFREENQS